MKVQTRSLSYAVFRPQVALGLKLFHRNFAIEGLENIPGDTPVVLISNHQNALMDAVLICGALEKQCHWLTRADMFKKEFSNKLLRGLNMLPVYRDRDKLDDLSEKNAEIFRICRERLKKNCIISLFPEGTHRGLYKLWPFKKGVARLLAGANEEGIKNITLLPVGLDYTSFYEFGGSALIRIGKPVELAQLCDLGVLNTARGQYELTEKLRRLLLELVTHIQTDDFREAFTNFRGLIEHIGHKDTLSQRQRFFTQIVNDLGEDEKHKNFLFNVVEPLHSIHEQLRLPHDFVPERSTSLRRLWLLIMLPLALPALLTFAPIHLAAEWLVSRFIQDRLFRNSIRATIWIFLTPIYALFVIGIVAWIFGFIPAAASFSILLLSGAIARHWVHGARDILQWMKMKKIHSSHAEKCRSYKKLRKEFTTYIREHYAKL